MMTRKAGWSTWPESKWRSEILQDNAFYEGDATTNFKHGRHIYMGPGSVIQGKYEGSLTIGDNVWIGPMAYIEGFDVTIGNNVGIGSGVRIQSSKHSGIPVTTPANQTDLIIEPVVICDGADIGVNAVILPGVTIGEGAIIGAGAVVTKDVPAFEVWAGVPARFLKMRGE